MIKQYRKLIAIGIGLLLVASIYVFVNQGITPSLNNSKLTLDDFDFVYREIELNDVKAKVGEPNSDSVYIYKYELSNGDCVMLRYSALTKLQGAWILYKDGRRVDFFTKEPYPTSKLEDWDFLARGVTSYSEVVQQFGEPLTEWGSGQHIAVYQLTDGRELTLILGVNLDQPDEIEYVIGDAFVSSNEGKQTVNFFGP